MKTANIGYLSPVEFEHKMLQFVNKEFDIKKVS